MRVSLPNRQLVTPPRPLACAVAALVLLAVASARGAVPFTVTFSGDGNGPRVTVLNESRQRIAHMELTIGDIAKHFDGGAYSLTPPPGGTAVNLTATRTDQISIDLTGFDPGESFSFYFDPDTDGANDALNYRTILFNNGGNTANAILRVRDEAGALEQLELPDPGAADLASYTFSSVARPRTITVKSVSEDGAADYVKMVQVKINSQYVRTNSFGALVYPGTDSNGQLLVGAQEAITVYDDEVVEIIAPREVYKDITGADITDSVTADPDNILRFAEELYRSAGLSVNNEPQSALNYYRFTVATNTDVLVQWQHEYALSIGHDFRATASSEQGYAGPLFSDADGNPDPPAPKAWIRKGTIVSPTVAGQIVDTISHPNLDIRFINKGYQAGGAAHRANPGPTVVGTNFVVGLYAWAEQGTNLPAGVSLTASLGLPPDRQQVAGFAMSGPAKLVYVWQIQYGIRVSAPGREAIPRIFTPNPANSAQLLETSLGAGTFWFNPGDSVVVAAPALDGQLALNGWFDGDGFYFGSQGDVSTVDGSLVSSGGTAPNVEWQATVPFSDPAGRIYRGLRIPQLTRPARLVWTYGNPGVAVAARLGEFVFQNDPTNANNFITPPDSVTVLNIRGINQNVAPGDATIWDANAQRLFPLVAGRFRVTWRKGTAPNQATNDVILDVDYPAAAHYPHIAGAPAVALDPDPDDDFVFKAIKYTENGALVDASRRFTATNSGRTVLLFGKIQRVGRGEPREFVQVRVVETTAYSTVLDYDEATIGQ